MEIISYLVTTGWNIFLIVVLIIAILGIIKLYRKISLSPLTKKVLWRISFIFVLLTPFIIPISVADKSQFRVLAFGFPFSFIEQHTNHVVISREFPFMTTLINPWGHSIMSNLNIRVDLYLISVACVYVILKVIAYAAVRVRQLKGNG